MEIPENRLIDKIRRFADRSRDVLRGIGDDGAVIKLSQGSYVLVQDAMVEHVHFKFSFTNPYDVGKKAVYVNISDVLSMGALPLYFLVTIGITPALTSKDIGRLYHGMRQAAREFGAIMIGGDTTESKSDFFIDVSMIGKLVTKTYLGRDRAKEGDLIAVTGSLGESAYGLHLLLEGKPTKGMSTFLKRYASPKPPYPVWKEIVKHDITRAMMDISDGLLIDLGRMMAESKKGAVIHLEKLPIPPLLRKKNKEVLALSGGEDYQLLFTFPKSRLKKIQGMIQQGYPISIIGEVKQGKDVTVLSQGKVYEAPEKGYEHFGNSR
ncbi:MAG TPA: thiamine-phosphate kinase [Syntrophorhabdus sp.]|jgi:thiamine-monophosphate kinase|nr:thiamine-phosphate kinase [Syntrophorhabdus sp.]MDI9558728.1 thiamine-phosphate kinase [Pseudomonadota bacterium]OQB75808.1 MAG: Thiamine-monophosphate kinase [Deltaproteobacteria bacterium ADurb.Bin135]MBP8744378.1 thiamine-phosphate kinase [Syntrophorhabdus sp.]NMC93735.1 thiamine-phosphate kinase [Syntrophorhabdus sp.]